MEDVYLHSISLPKDNIQLPVVSANTLLQCFDQVRLGPLGVT